MNYGYKIEQKVVIHALKQEDIYYDKKSKKR